MRLVAGILLLTLAGAARGELLIIEPDDFPIAVPPPEMLPQQAEPQKPALKVEDKPAVKNEQFAPFPGGIVDKDWKKAYVVGTGGTLDAIDLATGKLLWRSAVQAIPLAIDGDRVYALSPGSGNPPALNVVGLSIKGEGKMEFKSDSISVEEWVAGDITGTALKATIAIESGKMKLSWAANGSLTTTAGIVRPGIRRALPRSTRAVTAEGSVVIDLEKGTVEEGKTKMTISTPATQVTQGAVEYRLFSEAGKSIVESRDAKSKKTNWQVEVMPAGGAQAPQEMGGAAPMQPMPRAKLLPADAGELFANVQVVEFHNVEWRMGDEIMDPPQYGN